MQRHKLGLFRHGNHYKNRAAQQFTDLLGLVRSQYWSYMQYMMPNRAYENDQLFVLKRTGSVIKPTLTFNVDDSTISNAVLAYLSKHGVSYATGYQKNKRVVTLTLHALCDLKSSCHEDNELIEYVSQYYAELKGKHTFIIDKVNSLLFKPVNHNNNVTSQSKISICVDKYNHDKLNLVFYCNASDVTKLKHVMSKHEIDTLDVDYTFKERQVLNVQVLMSVTAKNCVKIAGAVVDYCAIPNGPKYYG